MNTKVLLTISSLLIVMNGINVGQAMEYWEPSSSVDNKIELLLDQKISKLTSQLLLPGVKDNVCKNLIEKTITWIASKKQIIDAIKNYSFDTSEELFAFVFNIINNNNMLHPNRDIFGTLIALQSIMVRSEQHYQNEENVSLVHQFLGLIILKDMINKEEV